MAQQTGIFEVGDKIWYVTRRLQVEDSTTQGLPGVVTGYGEDANGNFVYQLSISQSPINIRLPELRIYTAYEDELSAR